MSDAPTGIGDDERVWLQKFLLDSLSMLSRCIGLGADLHHWNETFPGPYSFGWAISVVVRRSDLGMLHYFPGNADGSIWEAKMIVVYTPDEMSLMVSFSCDRVFDMGTLNVFNLRYEEDKRYFVMRDGAEPTRDLEMILPPKRFTILEKANTIERIGCIVREKMKVLSGIKFCEEAEVAST